MCTHTILDAPPAPSCLRPVRLNRWRQPPDESGDAVPYDTFDAGKAEQNDPQWYEVELASGSHYSGGTVTLANYRELSRMLSEADDVQRSPAVWCKAYGGHGTYSLFVVYEALPEEIRDVLTGLDDYPSVNDEALSELECELGDEAWHSWGCGDMRRALEREFSLDDLDLPDNALFDLFRIASERMGHDWQFETGAQAYFDFERAAREIVNAMHLPPAWLDAHQHASLEMLRAVLRADADSGRES